MVNNEVVKSSDQRVLALRDLIGKRKQELGEAPKAKYESNLQYGNKNVLVMNLVEVKAAIGDLLGIKDLHQRVNDLIGDDGEYKHQKLLDDLILQGKILVYKNKESEINTLSKKLEALRSEDLRVADELDQLESLLK